MRFLKTVDIRKTRFQAFENPPVTCPDSGGTSASAWSGRLSRLPDPDQLYPKPECKFEPDISNPNEPEMSGSNLNFGPELQWLDTERGFPGNPKQPSGMV